jgi:hypothetical protein
VQANVFQCDLVEQETLIFVDLSKDRPEIVVETLAEAKSLKETSFIDNPYISGGK